MSWPRAARSCAPTCRRPPARPASSPRTSPPEYGGHGLDMRGRAVVFEEAGWSLFGPLALNIAAPDEGNMHLLEAVATAEQKERYLRPLAAGRGPVVLRDDRARPGRRLRPGRAVDHAPRPRRGAGWSTGASGSSPAPTARRSRSAWRARRGARATAAAPRCSSSTPTHPACGSPATSTPSTRASSAATASWSSDDVFVPDEAVLGAVDEGFELRPGPARAGAADPLHALARHRPARPGDRGGTGPRSASCSAPGWATSAWCRR